MTSLRSAWLSCLVLVYWGAQLALAGDIPPVPARYVEDKAGLLSPADADSLNSRLENFEKETSNQLVVAIYPTLPDGAELAQFSTETFQAWGVGQKKEDNGVVLFIFSKDRKMFIATGTGLEGALPDATCKTIITQEIAPRFKQSDFSGGITAGTDAIMAATRGEYQGNGRTQADHGRVNTSDGIQGWIVLIFLVIVVITVLNSKKSGSTLYRRGGTSPWSSGGGWGGGSSGGWGGGGGGGSSGGFSGGGGGTSGGGAGGSW